MPHDVFETVDRLFESANLTDVERLRIAHKLLAGIVSGDRSSLFGPEWDGHPSATTRLPRLERPTGLATRTAAQRQAIYASACWRQAYAPGVEVHCYILRDASGGLGQLAQLLGKPLYMWGTTSMGRLNERISEHNRARYASHVRSPDGSGFVPEPGFCQWQPVPKLQLAVQPTGLVRASTASLIVTLPTSLAPSKFEAALNRALLPISLRHFVDSDAGRHYCSERGIDARKLLRFSRDKASGVVEAATEIMIFRPQADTPILAAVIEDIIIDHVLRSTVQEAA